MNVIANPLARDRFAAMCGIELIESRPGYAKTRMVVDAHHRNSLDMVHGGALFTLGAAAFFAASNASGKVAVGINASIAFVNPTESDVLFAEAVETSRGRKVAHCDVRVTDATEKLIATLHCTAFIKDRPFPESTDRADR